MRSRWKRSSKTLSRQEKSANNSLSFLFGQSLDKFSNTMIMSYILQRMLCKGCYRISIVVAFSYGRAKIVRIRDVPRVFLEKGGKIPVFNNIRIHVDKDICISLRNCVYRAFSLAWPASMQIYWNKRKRLHKKRIQLPQDCLATPTWPPFNCFGTPIWSPWRHVKTLYSSGVYTV